MTHADDMHSPPGPAGFFRSILVRVLLSGWCPAPLARAIHRMMQTDPAMSAAYSASRRIERAASGRAFSPGQVDLVEQLIMGAVAEAEAAESSRELSWASSWRAVVAPLSAAAAMVFVFVATGDNVQQPETAVDVWTTRGGSAPRVGVRARCIDAAARKIIDSAEAGPASDVDVLTCPRGGLLSLSITNLDDEAVYVYAVGVADDGLRFLSPFSESSSSLRIAPNTVDVPLDVVADTAALPPDENIAIFTLFSPKALRGPDVARTIRAAQDRAVRVQSLDRLPVEALTTRIELRP
jgi:hypothetical protein